MQLDSSIVWAMLFCVYYPNFSSAWASIGIIKEWATIGVNTTGAMDVADRDYASALAQRLLRLVADLQRNAGDPQLVCLRLESVYTDAGCAWCPNPCWGLVGRSPTSTRKNGRLGSAQLAEVMAKLRESAVE